MSKMKQTFTLLAMGNWGNTPSPPLDSGAPDPVGNEGELRLDVDGKQTVYLIQSARLSESGLSFEGEKVGGQPNFTLTASLPDGAFDASSVRGKRLEIQNATFRDIAKSVSAGTLSLVSITGSGPWEIDGELEFTNDSGDSVEGKFQARLRA